MAGGVHLRRAPRLETGAQFLSGNRENPTNGRCAVSSSLPAPVYEVLMKICTRKDFILFDVDVWVWRESNLYLNDKDTLLKIPVFGQS